MVNQKLDIENLFFSKELSINAPFSILAISGPDSLSFINRLSTNDLNNLLVNESACTIFLNSKGKIVDQVFVFRSDPEKFLLVSSHADENILLDWLEKYHFSENLELAKNNNFFISFFISETAPDLNSYRHFLLGQGQIKTTNFFLGLKISSNEISPNLELDVWESVRIALKIPLWPNEVNETLMPQECGLNNFVSVNKGCYLGQEVIAKAKTYQKNKKALYALEVNETDYLKLRQNYCLNDLNLKEKITSLSPYFIADRPSAILLLKESEAIILKDSLKLEAL